MKYIYLYLLATLTASIHSMNIRELPIFTNNFNDVCKPHPTIIAPLPVCPTKVINTHWFDDPLFLGNNVKDIHDVRKSATVLNSSEQTVVQARIILQKLIEEYANNQLYSARYQLYRLNQLFFQDNWPSEIKKKLYIQKYNQFFELLKLSELVK